MQANNFPLVTVITPAYNQGIFLRETIESVLAQDYPNIELYVINDGSTDNTEEILKEYTGRIKWETQKNMGQTPTINKGWNLTNGEIITWLNSDDTYLPGAVRKGVEYLLSHPETGVVYGDTLVTESDGSPREKSKDQSSFDYFLFVKNCDNCIVQPSSFIRRDVIKKVSDLDPVYYYFMDWDFWLRAGLYFKIDYIPELLSTYRMHAESKTVAQSKKAAPELEYMYNKYFSREDIPEKIKKVQKSAMMNMYFRTAGYYLIGGDKENAAIMASKAIKANPMGLFSLTVLKKYIHCRFSR